MLVNAGGEVDNRPLTPGPQEPVDDLQLAFTGREGRRGS